MYEAAVRSRLLSRSLTLLFIRLHYVFFLFTSSSHRVRNPSAHSCCFLFVAANQAASNLLGLPADFSVDRSSVLIRFASQVDKPATNVAVSAKFSLMVVYFDRTRVFSVSSD